MDFFAVFLLFAALLSPDDAPDAVKGELEQARTAYEQQLETAKSKLAAAADAKLQEYTAKGDFESVKEIKSESEAFERDGAIPKSGKLSSVTAKYKSEVRAAAAALQKALEKAKSEYTKAKMLSEAEAIDDELKELTAKHQATTDKSDPSADLLQKGTLWKGSKTYPNGKKADYELQIESRQGTKFTAIGRGNPKYSVWDIAGTLDDGKIEWSVTKVRSGVGAPPHKGVLAGDIIRFEFMPPSGKTATGELKLVSKADAPPTASNISGEPPSDESPQAQKMPNVADFEKFLAMYDRAWDTAQKRLAQAMENEKKAIRSSDWDADEIRQHIDAIDRDLADLKAKETLPRSDYSLAAVVPILADYQKTIENLESTRKHWAKRAVQLNDRGAIAKLDALEQRLNGIIGGREQFTTGSSWSGTFAKHGLGRKGKKVENVSFKLNLTVTNCTGAAFDGELRQGTGGGQHSKMAVEGKLDRNQIAFGTTQMILGKKRNYAFRGYLLSDRIIAEVNGFDVNGHPAVGWMSLWRSGDASGKRGAAQSRVDVNRK